MSLHLISFVFPPRMFALTQVPFIETSVIKCKTLPGTTGRAARNCHTYVCRRAAGRGWQGPRALPGGPAAFSPLSLVQAGNMTTKGIGQGGSKHPRCSRQRRLVVSLIHARRGANKTAKLILTGDLNPILSQVPEATNQHTAFCTAVPLLLSRSKTHNPGLQRASPNYTPN